MLQLNFLAPIAVHQQVPEVAVTSVSNDRLQVYADQFGADQIQLFYQMLLVGRKDIQIAPDPETGFEMLMLRLLAFAPQDGSASENTAGASSGKKN